MTPTTLQTLFDMRREDITLGGDIFALNSRLGLKPWQPPAVEVWVHREPPDNLNPEQRDRWLEVLQLLDELHAEHLRRKNTESK